MTAIASRITVSILHAANTDTELARRIVNFLYQRRVPGGECIRLNVHGGVVAVGGTIPTRYGKWLCLECCRRVAGVLRVIDNVKIEPAVEERPAVVHIAREIKTCRRHRFGKSDVYRDRSTIPFRPQREPRKRTFTASSGPKLMAAA